MSNIVRGCKIFEEDTFCIIDYIFIYSYSCVLSRNQRTGICSCSTNRKTRSIEIWKGDVLSLFRHKYADNIYHHARISRWNGYE